MNQDDFDFSLVGGRSSPFVGYISAVDKTMVNERAMVRGSKNVYKPERGTYAVRPGLKTYGEADATVAGVQTAYVWNTSLATVRYVRTCNGKLQVMSTIADGSTQVWYDLLTGLTETQAGAFVYDTWWNNTLKKDVLLFVYSTDDLQMWHGGIGKISSTTATTIVLTATVASQGFNTASGSVLVNGTTYTYTGSSGSTLTGVSPNPTGEANGSIVLSAVVVSTNEPTSDFLNDFIKVINNRLHCGSYTSRLIYISAQDDYTNFSPGTAPGDPELLTLDSLGKGIGVRQGQAHIFGGNQDLYVVSYNDIAVGASVERQTSVSKKVMAGLEAPVNHNFIGNVGDDLVWLSQEQELKTYGTFRNLNEPVFPTLSLAVKQELQQQDFTGGAIACIGEFVYLTAPNSGAVWLHQTHTTVTPVGNVSTERLWHAPFIWNLSRIIEIAGVQYGTSNANPMTYQLWDTLQWHDDSPSGDALPYTCILAMAFRQIASDRSKVLKGDKTYYEGYMSPGSEVNVAMILDYQGSTGVLASVLNGPDDLAVFFQGNVGASLGDSSLGDNPLGDGVSDVLDAQESLPKFRSIIDVNPKDAFEYQLRVYSNEPDSNWEILALGSNIDASLNKPTWLRKS